MGSLLYIRLICYTAGTLLYLFWMVVIVGYRRQRNFERVFFSLCLALFFFYAGSLLALNAQIYYSEPPTHLTSFAKALLCVGLGFLPPLLVHLHFEYADTRQLLQARGWKRPAILVAFVPIIYFALWVYPKVVTAPGFNFLIPGDALGRCYAVWLAASLFVSVAWEIQFTRKAPDAPQKWFHALFTIVLAFCAALVLYLHVWTGRFSPNSAVVISSILALLPIAPSAALICLVQRFNFLQIARQKNLVYAVSATFLALLYLSLVRRVSVWLEPLLPPEASASILLFVLVIFIEPLQRLLARTLKETAHREMDRVQRLTAEIQQEARQGNLKGLVRFIEQRLKEEFELGAATVEFIENSGAESVTHTKALTEQTPASGHRFVLRKGSQPLAILRAEPHGAPLSGETRAALEFLCEQLPGALDLCHLIDEKLRLERELAERERLAMLGQMAASISHNLKNPLGSIKTILQVQLENPELPASIRPETKMVLEEIGRLSRKLNQLLQFSTSTVRPGNLAGPCEFQTVLQEVVALLRHEAERREIALRVEIQDGSIRVLASAEAVNDIATNLLVNALEAAPRGGHVFVGATANSQQCIFVVEDDGPGIPAALKEKVLQPFFTTKSQGTGLGLAIVARRVTEFGGLLDWNTPLKDARGTRFRVTLPQASTPSSQGADRPASTT
ncbi:MAG TPA: ATP-binding protein [Candidatus Dormibacteraeota bacterium]|nr:ATP-binding protein [Candidatus Dormibacteraeota bacterium]